MALDPALFVHPTGKLQAAMFPGEVLADLLDAWITEAEAKVVNVTPALQDAAATFWVYYRAYDTIAHRIGVSPTRESYGGNSGGGVQSTVDWGQNKSDYWARLAQAALDSFNAYVPAEPVKDKGWTFNVF